jgi:hypothetical protein
MGYHSPILAGFRFAAGEERLRFVVSHSPSASEKRSMKVLDRFGRDGCNTRTIDSLTRKANDE